MTPGIDESDVFGSICVIGECGMGSGSRGTPDEVIGVVIGSGCGGAGGGAGGFGGG